MVARAISSTGVRRRHGSLLESLISSADRWRFCSGRCAADESCGRM